MNIKGIQKTSLVDFPGRLSSVLFVSGCNFNCGYCYNIDLVSRKNDLETYADEEILKLLKARSSLIESVVITGGEPTLYKDLDVFIQQIKNIPLFVKLDSNGYNPHVIDNLLKRQLIDYIAIDIKTSPAKYESLTGINIDFNRIRKTINIIKNSYIDYEFRTTCVPYYVTLDDFKIINNEIGHVKKYFLQQYSNNTTLNPEFMKYNPYPVSTLNDFREYVNTFADTCEIRGAA
jgi:pyruvate formate lyase activating enzyme